MTWNRSLSFGNRVGLPRGIAVTRLNVDSLFGGPLLPQQTRTVASAVDGDYALDGVAALPTQYHWNVLYRQGSGSGQQLVVRRLGHSGLTTEQHVVETGAHLAAAIGRGRPSDPLQPAPILYALDGGSQSTDRIWGATVRLPSGAGVTTYGNACGGSLSRSVLSANPYAGGVVTLSFGGPSPGTACVLWSALGKADLPLLGGCRLLLDPASKVVVSAFTHQPVALYGHMLPVFLPDGPTFRPSSTFRCSGCRAG